MFHKYIQSVRQYNGYLSVVGIIVARRLQEQIMRQSYGPGSVCVAIQIGYSFHLSLLKTRVKVDVSKCRAGKSGRVFWVGFRLKVIEI